MSHDPNLFSEKLTAICQQLKAYDDIRVEENFLRLQQRSTSLADALRQEDENGRLLRIGIVGSVKAGKSTFLNALLFDGESVLPKAATPMTASLTRLRYASEQYARFEFYSHADWESICDVAEAGRECIRRECKKNNNHARSEPDKVEWDKAKRKLSPVQQACIELEESAQRNGLDLTALLGTSKTVPLIDVSEAGSVLREHIGSDGKLTPVVRYVELGICNDMLRDLEIVDTPGLNDPVRSRSAETYKALARCDTVFILSRASQFLTQADVDLLKNTLRENGISRKVIVATQMDAGALCERGKVQEFKQAFRLTRTAVTNMYNEHMRGEGTPVCVSALLAACAFKMDKMVSLDNEENLVLENLASFENAPKTAVELRQVANMSDVHRRLEISREHKNSIILEHKLQLINSTQAEALSCLRALERHIATTRRMLVENDYASLEQGKENIGKALESVRGQISELFIQQEAEVKQSLSGLGQRIIANIDAFNTLEVSKDVHDEDRSYTTGMLFWKKKHYRTVQITTHTAELSDSLAQLRNYAAKVQDDINRTFKILLPINQIGDSIKLKILPIIRGSGVAFDEDFILTPLNAALHSLSVPPFIFDNSPYNDRLVKLFDGTVEGEAIHRLKSETELAFQDLGKDICSKMRDAGNEISQKLLNASVDFTDSIHQKLSAQLDRVIEQLGNREKHLQLYDKASTTLHQCTLTLVKDFE